MLSLGLATLHLRMRLSLAIDDLRSLNPRDKAVLDRLSRYVDASGKTLVRQQQLGERDLCERGVRSVVACTICKSWATSR